jgi:hypothetical protein
MSVPSIIFRRLDRQTGAVSPSNTGVGVIIAAAVAGTMNQPIKYTNKAALLTNCVAGPLVEDVAYAMIASSKPVIGVRCNASVAGTLSQVLQIATGNFVCTGSGAPIDEFNCWVTFVTGGTFGTTGITYQVSLDGTTESQSGELALGTALTIQPTIPNEANTPSGIILTFGTGQTVVAGDQVQVFTTRPQPNAGDVTAALNSLARLKMTWEAVYVDKDAVESDVPLLDMWLASLETNGIYNEGILSTRHKKNPVTWVPDELAFAACTASAAVTPQESESTFLASATITGFGAVSSDRLAVCTDAGDLVSVITGLTQPRQAGLALLADAMSIPIGQDPSWVAAGAVAGYNIDDANGNGKWHDEMLDPGLDDLGFTTFRSWPQEVAQGTFFDNARVFSGPGSDYVFFQQLRVINAAMTACFVAFSQWVGAGVTKQQPATPNGPIYISLGSAGLIESGVNNAVSKAVKGQVNDVNFQLAKDDDIGSNDGAILNATLQAVCLAYIKGGIVASSFARSISVPVAA